MSDPHFRSTRTLYIGLLEALVKAMGEANGYLFHHGPRTAVIALRICRNLELERVERAEVLVASLLQDLGMVGLVEDAWENPVPVLPGAELDRVRSHPLRSETLVASIPHLDRVAPLVRHHHEWWDGSGYPDGLKGAAIPLGARILRVADTVAALGEERPQRGAASTTEIIETVRSSRGEEFDPEVADAFLSLASGADVRPIDRSRLPELLVTAAGHLLPPEVSGLSAQRLLEVFGGLIDHKDPYTGGHSRRVSLLGGELARGLGLGEEFCDSVLAAGHLHDLGKLSIPVRVLTKPGGLSLEERKLVQDHAVTGARLLEGVPGLRRLAPGVRYHHERWDGGGYPEGISGDRIPKVAQVLAVADTYDAMTSRRAYRPPLEHDHAVEMIGKESGRQFAPAVVEVLESLTTPSFELLRAPEPELARLFQHPRRSRSRSGLSTG